MQDRRAAAKALVVEEAKEASRFTTPKPGAKPKASTNRPVVNPSKITDSTPNGDASAPTSNGSTGGNGGVSMSKPPGEGPAPGAKPSPGAKPAAGNKPAPGAKPARGGSKKKR